jgi:hypothetical protein
MTTVLSSNLLMQAIRSLIPLGSLRDGEVVEARVNTMLSTDVARLTLLGATLDVNTPVQLVPGSTIEVAVERRNDGLRLVLQRDANGVTAQPASSQEDRRTGGLRSLSLVIAQAVIDGALDAAGPLSKAPEMLPKGAGESGLHPETKATASESQPEPLDNSGLANLATNVTAHRASAFRPANPQGQGSGTTRPSSEPADQRSIATPAAAAPSNASTVAYLPPGAAQPFNLTFVREDKEGGGDAQAERSGPAWTVRVSFDSRGLGPLHAAIRLSGANIGVTIWAERPEVATALQQDSAELRNTLQEAALNVEAVAVLAGRPPGQNNGADGLHAAIL